MEQYLLLLREDPTAGASLSPAEISQLVARYAAWARSLSERGLLVDANKLTDDGGKLLRGDQGRLFVTDGPFAETKDVIGGYFLLRADSEAQVLELVKECPHLTRPNHWIELRRIDTRAG